MKETGRKIKEMASEKCLKKTKFLTKVSGKMDYMKDKGKNIGITVTFMKDNGIMVAIVVDKEKLFCKMETSMKELGQKIKRMVLESLNMLTERRTKETS